MGLIFVPNIIYNAVNMSAQCFAHELIGQAWPIQNIFGCKGTTFFSYMQIKVRNLRQKAKIGTIPVVRI